MRNLGCGWFYGNPGTMPGTPSSLLYRLKMILGGISPMIWCRLLVPADMILYGLHQGSGERAPLISLRIRKML